jgi:hypothetical protein
MTEPVSMRTARSFGELADMMKNQRVHVRVLSGFIMQGRQPAEPGEILQVSRSFASELCASDKAEIVPAPPPKPDPNLMPQFETPPLPPSTEIKLPKAKS